MYILKNIVRNNMKLIKFDFSIVARKFEKSSVIHFIFGNF